ncbi:MAG: glycoside hydrolase domain-containing protein [Armatimonadota bacterium]
MITLMLTLGIAQMEPPPPADWQPGVGQTFTRREVFIEAQAGKLPGESPTLTRTDRVVLGVKGTGNDMSWWRNMRLQLQPNRTYAVEFWLKGTGTGACAITGTNTVNRDFQPPRDWTQKQFIFRTPANTRDTFLRFGQWHWNGEILFDRIRLIPVEVVHAALGEGEQIRNGRYLFTSRYEHLLSNAQAPLQRFTAYFNTNRWVFERDWEVIYRHQAGDYPMQGATLRLNVPFEQNGRLTVLAQREGESDWRVVGQVQGRGEHQLQLPRELFPARALLVRLLGEGEGTIQVSYYALEATLQGAERASITGRSLVLFPSGQSHELRLTDLRLEQDSRGRWQLVGSVTNTGQQPLKVQPFVGETRTATLTLDPGKPTPIRFLLPPPGLEELAVELGVRHERGGVLWSAKLTLPVSILNAANYGYRIAGTPPALGVWWCEWGWKVGRERPLPNALSRTVKLSAARGEYEPVQIVLRPQRDTVLQRVEISDLTSGKHRLPAKHLTLREVAYVFVEHPTDWLGEPGEYPDPLPPLQTPLHLQAGRNQPLWLTVYVPYGTPAGDYKGTIRLVTDKGIATVPLTLTVYDFDLPHIPTLRSGFGIDAYRIEQYHKVQTEEQKRELWDRYMRNFKEHRLAPYNFYAYDPYEVRFEGEGTEKRVVLDFTRFDRAARRYLDEIGFNAFVLPIHGLPWGRYPNYSPGEFGGFREGTPEYERLWSEYMRQLTAHLRERGWLKKAYVYWFDEPEEADYPFVRRVNERLKQVAPDLTRMLTEQPEEPLIGAVDLWCPLTAFVPPESIKARRQAGEEVWWYVCTGPRAPYVTLFIDHPGTEMRVWLWQTWQYGVQGILIWQTTWWHNEFAYPDRLQDPWQDPMSYVWDANFKPGTRQFWGNGDGRLLYPPRRDPNTATEPIVDDPIPSIRWECLRDGAEDYEYFVLLQRLCEPSRQAPSKRVSRLAEQARALLQVPPEVSKSMTEFTRDPRPLLQHRDRIARMIERMRRANRSQ